jgi:hypothetical protein
MLALKLGIYMALLLVTGDKGTKKASLKHLHSIAYIPLWSITTDPVLSNIYSVQIQLEVSSVSDNTLSGRKCQEGAKVRWHPYQSAFL